MQRLSCTGKTTGEGCCEKAEHNTTRHVSGAIYCDSTKRKISQLLPGSIPNYIGPSSGRAVVPRTRRNILERAIGWLAVHTPYMGCGTPSTDHSAIETCATDDPAECPQYAHTASCEGLVTLAYGTPEKSAKDDRVFKDCRDALPADAVRIHTKGGDTPHDFLFRQFLDDSDPLAGMRIFQMGGGHGAANMGTKEQGYKFCEFPPKGKQTSCLECYTYSHVVNEIAAPWL